ncbi:MAG: oligosaccharide flippase family protein [Gomphosphaeria aponina SAG 52.96 = DSM 107014]|uniref:Oligosaccharide flippase family protein n=1 Tax=Gomphosphaeria aponina SAG 52.96 = DSM 107014 TaxID=1521640 RepID=A0A941GWW0_9CHRO|nr:oligosaccharide flippase family protein [Gomphosphaeria aponina SAG 52.96 = DSM 107014]
MSVGISKLLRGGSLMVGGQAGSQALSFLRNALIGRMVSKEDFGIAATFTITVSLFELISQMAVDQLLVQAKDGDDPELQNAAHLVTITRGIVGAVFMFFLAPIITKLFDIPEATWAFRWLALVPLLRGFIHLDPQRYQRDMRLAPLVLIEFIPQVVMALAVYPLIEWLGDYSAVLWLVIIQAGIFLIVTHLLAERPYGISFNQGYLERIFIFGWPLLINGLLMFGIFQGDKIIVGKMYDIEFLGVYSAAFMMTMTPAMLIIKTIRSLLLPIFSRSQSKRTQFIKRYSLGIELLSLLTGLFAIFFIVCGGTTLSFVFGDKYIGYGAIVGWTGIMWSIRILRSVPTIAAVAMGDTKNSMISNFYRTLALFFTLMVALKGGNLAMIAASGAVGEVLALVVTAWRLQNLQKIPINICFIPLVITIIFWGVSWLIVLTLGENSNFVLGIISLALVSLTFAVSTALICGELRKSLFKACFSVIKK